MKNEQNRFINIIKNHLLNTLFKLLILLFHFSFVANNRIICIKTNAIINSIVIYDSLNNVIQSVDGLNIAPSGVYQREIIIEYGYYMEIELSRNSPGTNIWVGFLLKIGNEILTTQSPNFKVTFNPSMTNNGDIVINSTSVQKYSKNINNVKITAKICYISCSKCNQVGNETNHNCVQCKNKYYFKENESGNCYSNSTIEPNYYLHSNKYKLCNENCLSCNGPSSNNCLSCNNSENLYLFEENHSCITKSSKPHNYYLDINDKIIRKCHRRCYSCSTGPNEMEMNCDSCIENYYFQSETSSNCNNKSDGFYLETKNERTFLAPCYEKCETCDTGGNVTFHNCTKCKNDLLFDVDIINNCIEEDLECNLGCYKCFKQSIHSTYGFLPPSQRCRICNSLKEYAPLQKETEGQFYVVCHPQNNPPKNYYYDRNENVHKLCYESCLTCNETGNSTYHNCLSCEFNHHFLEEKPNNCFPICTYNYYFTKYKQYKCTEKKQCPEEYPLFIEEKSKCIDYCNNDPTYIYTYTYLNRCFRNCPEGTVPINFNDTYKFCQNGTSGINCTLDIKKNVTNLMGLKKDEKDYLLEIYAKEYNNEHPYLPDSVTIYNDTDNNQNGSLIILYKMERCAVETFDRFKEISLNLKDCMDKKGINQIALIAIFYTFRKKCFGVRYKIYPEEIELYLSDCDGLKTSCAMSIFDYDDIDGELVLFFGNKGINIFNPNDPFFVDLCFVFSIDGKDVPLVDRIELYYQNVTFCDEGCNLEELDLEKYEVLCSCHASSEKDDKIVMAKTLLDNPFSGEVVGFISKMNINVFTCIKKAFASEVIFSNKGGLIVAGISIFQLILSIMINYKKREIRNYIYQIINELCPPEKEVIVPNNLDEIKKLKFKHLSTLDDEKKYKKGKNQSKIYRIKKANPYKYSSEGDSTNKNQNDKLKINEMALEYLKGNWKQSKDNQNNEIQNKTNRKNKPNENNDKKTKLNRKRVNTDNNPKKNPPKKNSQEQEIDNYADLQLDEYGNEAKIHDIHYIKKELKMKIYERMKKGHKKKQMMKKNFVFNEGKDYDEEDLNELEYEEAVVFDKRNCCQMLGPILKERQLIINTFCENDELKPFSIKLSIFIFIFSCYFIINGLLFSDESISEIFNAKESKTFGEYIVGSFDRIIYTAMVNGIVDFILGMFFNTDKKIEDAIEKYKDNKIIMKGVISRISKCYDIVLVIYAFSLFLFNIFFTIYAFCFCYVYPNTIINWCQVTIFVILIYQLLSFLASMLIAFLKFLSIRFRWELCFKINSYLENNL